MGTEFSSARVGRYRVAIKVAGDERGRIERITISIPGFEKTCDGFWLRDRELVPWSRDDLANWRNMRNEPPRSGSSRS